MNSPLSNSAERLLIGAMLLAIFFTVTAIAMIGPLLVDMAAALGVSVPLAGQLVTVAGVTWAFAAILTGPVSDAYGRKPVLVAGTVLLAVGTAGIGLSPGFVTATVCAALLGAGGGMVPPTCIAVAGDVFPTARRASIIAILTTAPGVSSVLGVPATAVLGEHAGWRVAFLLVGGALLVSGALLAWMVSGARPESSALRPFGRLARAVAVPMTWQIGMTNMLARLTWGVVLTFFAPYLILTYGLSTADVALPLALVALWATAAPTLGGFVGRSRHRLLVTSFVLAAGAIPGFLMFTSQWGTWVSVLAAGLFALTVIPVTTVSSIVFAEAGGASRGTLAGVISSTNWGGTGVGAAIGGLLVAGLGYSALSWMLATAVIAGALLLGFTLNERKVEAAQAQYSGTP